MTLHNIRLTSVETHAKSIIRKAKLCMGIHHKINRSTTF